MTPLPLLVFLSVLSLPMATSYPTHKHLLRRYHPSAGLRPATQLPNNNSTTTAHFEDIVEHAQSTITLTRTITYEVFSSATTTPAAEMKPSSTEEKTKTTGRPRTTQPALISDGAPAGARERVAALAPIPGLKNTVSFSDVYPKGKSLQDLPIIKQASTSRYVIGTFRGRTAIKATMAKGSINPQSGVPGGMSFYSPAEELQSDDADHYMFSYSVYFDDGFEFNLGGKLPGLFGGTSLNVAVKCSGGDHEDGCWSMRLMWRKDGAGELYAYIPPPTASTPYNKNDMKCGKAAKSKCTTDYGYSIGTKTWTWPRNKWTTVAERIKLNTVGKANGEAEIFVNGKSVLLVKGLVYRTKKSSKAYGRQMQTFFGGHTKEWASPKNQDLIFSDFLTAIVT